jgi:HAD domain in Swiss Army Knife RNA repair proteins
MRILFLDFDGVLHPSSATSHSDGWFCWLPTLFSLLDGHADIRVVVHSSWRYEYTDPELKKLLGPAGQWFAGSAPRLRRELAIQAVLQANKEALTSYLVIDDDEKEFAGSSLAVVFCGSSVGISDARVQESIAGWLVRTAPK